MLPSSSVLRLPKDMNKEISEISIDNPDKKAAHFKGAYLLIINSCDAPEETVQVYVKRWKI